MAFENFAVIDVSGDAGWFSEHNAYVANLPDEISRLQQRERNARYALEANGFYDAITQIKNPQQRERLQGLALILGDLHTQRCNSNEAMERYEHFLEKYKSRIEKAEGV
ncbi:MAG: hypothetical protein NTY99_01195 [DPANN group archaeon]|nr:hypothetical protein [DPANN group archaeon]